MPAAVHGARGSAGGPRAGQTPSLSSSASPPPASFFIIHEPDAAIRPSDGSATASNGSAASPSGRNKSRKKPLASSTAPAPQTVSPVLRHAERDEERGIGDDGVRRPVGLALETNNAAELQLEPALSVLSRCGSAPDLPLHSCLSSGVYSSSAKRLQRSSAANGAHQAALQRSRLTPLPVDIRTGTMSKRSIHAGLAEPRSVLDAGLKSPEPDGGSPASALKAQVASSQAAVEGLTQRLAEMERERAAAAASRRALERQSQQLRQENRQCQADKAALERRVDELAQQLMQCQHKLDKLTDRYAGVCAGLQKLGDARQTPSASPEAAAQAIVHALARENQELQRKLRVLEARHVEDKALASNHDKRLKRLRAEMEALRHIDEPAADGGARTERSAPDADPSLSSLAHAIVAPPRSVSRRATAAAAADSAAGRASDALASASASRRGPVATASASHLVSAEEFQFIDPNILKVLDKVDSQFSIANAISLSATLKKWLNSCLHVVVSTHVPTVLQALLKRASELLHCDHAAVFHVDHGAKRLTALCSERGEETWELPLDKGFLGYAARQNAVCNVRRAYDDPRFYSSTDSVTGLPSREVLCIPIAHELQPQLRAGGVVAVLQLWNTTHHKPFSVNDQVLASLLAIHVGAVVLQTKVGHRLLKASKKFHQIASLPHDVAEYALSLSPPPPPPAAVDSSRAEPGFVHIAAVDLVAAAETKLAECLGIKHVRVFGLDGELMKIWRVGRAADSATGSASRVRKYANAASSLCALALHTRNVLIVPEPSSEPSFNDMIDMAGGAGGLYLAAISSPWSTLPLGVVQVARSAKAGFVSTLKASGASRSDTKSTAELSEAGAAAALARARAEEQSAEDALVMELIAVFCRSFAGLLLHARAQQLHVDCPSEVRQARLAGLSDHLSWLQGEEEREQALRDEQVASAERGVSEASGMERRILDSVQREKLGSSHSRQGTPSSTWSADPSATQRESRAHGRRSSSNTPARMDSRSSELAPPATPSQRISSAGSPLRSRTPQRALEAAGGWHCDDETSSHDGSGRGDGDYLDETASNFVEGSDGASLLSLAPASASAEFDSNSGDEGDSTWDQRSRPASDCSGPADLDHAGIESPGELRDGADASELAGLGSTGSSTHASDGGDGERA